MHRWCNTLSHHDTPKDQKTHLLGLLEMRSRVAEEGSRQAGPLRALQNAVLGPSKKGSEMTGEADRNEIATCPACGAESQLILAWNRHVLCCACDTLFTLDDMEHFYASAITEPLTRGSRRLTATDREMLTSFGISPKGLKCSQRKQKTNSSHQTR